jgi:hypothetical protein
MLASGFRVELSRAPWIPKCNNAAAVWSSAIRCPDKRMVSTAIPLENVTAAVDARATPRKDVCPGGKGARTYFAAVDALANGVAAAP